MAKTPQEVEAEYYASLEAEKERQRNAPQPTNGETPLATLPAYGGRGGSQQAADFYAARDFAEIFGRNPTRSELSMLSAAYVSGDPNIADTSRGKSQIAQYYQSQSNTPDQINKGNQEKYLSEAPQHFDSVNQLFQSQLGRSASQEELNHFGSLIASGEADPYQIQQFLQQQPEYTEKKDQTMQEKIKQENLALQDQMKADNAAFQTDAQGKIKGFVSEAEAKNKAYQDELSGKLAGYDQQYFGEKILPTIQQTFAKQGRSFDSSGFQNSATQSAQQQNIARQQYLASLSADQYAQLQQQEGAMQSGLQGISANQYGNLQSQQAAQQAYLNSLGAGQYATRKDNAYNDYANMIANQQNLTNSGIQAQYQGTINTQNRVNEISDYNTQMQAYNQYLARAGKRNNSVLSGLQGAIGGATVGSKFGPWGAVAGAAGGGALGAYGGSY